MRLLNATTLKLNQFLDEATRPEYGILSHTWDATEVTFQDVQQPDYQITTTKILGCCQQALKDGLEWVWIDSCCIDKTSSSELSEAINSMFKWYAGSVCCYVYLSDVPSEPPVDGDPTKSRYASIAPGSAFYTSRWFSRGWTLQELIAPHKLAFYTSTWDPIGVIQKSENFREPNNVELAKSLRAITNIEWKWLISLDRYRDAAVGLRMSWAARRETTRPEDRAYSLLGVFEINMPLLYGEGGERAFLRLQEEIMRISDDQTLLAWNFGGNLMAEFEPVTPNQKPKYNLSYAGPDGQEMTLQPKEWEDRLFAASPTEFAECAVLVAPRGHRFSVGSHYSVTNKGLLIDMKVIEMPDVLGVHATHYGLLDCTQPEPPAGVEKAGWEQLFIAIPLCQIWNERQHRTFFRCAKSVVCRLSKKVFEGIEADRDGIYILKGGPSGRPSSHLYERSNAATRAYRRYFSSYVPILTPDTPTSAPQPVLKEFYMQHTTTLDGGTTLTNVSRVDDRPYLKQITSVLVPGRVWARYECEGHSIIVGAAYRNIEEYLAARHPKGTEPPHWVKRDGTVEDTESEATAVQQVGFRKGEGYMLRTAELIKDTKRWPRTLLEWLLTRQETFDVRSPSYEDRTPTVSVPGCFHLDAATMQWSRAAVESDTSPRTDIGADERFEWNGFENEKVPATKPLHGSLLSNAR